SFLFARNNLVVILIRAHHMRYRKRYQYRQTGSSKKHQNLALGHQDRVKIGLSTKALRYNYI
ncbi:MAG: hypothetical protein WCT03_17325, partial [Candidatus Obscuribacterales bacterium]